VCPERSLTEKGGAVQSPRKGNDAAWRFRINDPERGKTSCSSKEWVGVGRVVDD